MEQKSFYPQITEFIEKHHNRNDLVIWKKIQEVASRNDEFANRVSWALESGGTAEVRRALSPEFSYWDDLKVANCIDALDSWRVKQ